VDDPAIAALVDELSSAAVDDLYTVKAFDTGLHFCDHQNPDIVAQYLLVLDTLNWCFWPDEELEYAQLAGGLKRAVQRDPGAIASTRLATVTEEDVRQLVDWPRPLPLATERARLLRETGAALLGGYDGRAAELVRAAGGSAVQLVRLVTAAMPGFRDHAVYRGRQVFFYKRAQIFAADVYGAFGGRGLGAFHDVGELTMFSDYRVPQLLRELGVLRYDDALARQVDTQQAVGAGNEEEVQVRAGSVVAVERIRGAVAARRGGAALPPHSVAIDWMLWEEGEARRKQLRPHHRTLTLYY
jgi:hypothetical protein